MEHLETNIRKIIKILPVAAIYGANASGKSNIYSAFEYMSDYVAESFKYGDEEEKFEEFRPTPFLFDSTSADSESSFEVYFTLPGDKAEKTYNYGFCINKAQNPSKYALTLEAAMTAQGIV